MSEKPGTDDGVKFFADGNVGGSNEEELARLRNAILGDIAVFNREVPLLPETHSGVLDQVLTSKQALLAVLENPNKIWESVPLSEFRNNGKYNCLSIDPAGIVVLDIIKPGVHQRYTVKLAEHISLEGIRALRSRLLENPWEWENKLPHGFLAEGETEHNEQSTFDESRKNQPGAVFVADRTLDLGTIENLPLLLRWIVKHTNSQQINEPVKVDDIFRLEYKAVDIDGG